MDPIPAATDIQYLLTDLLQKHCYATVVLCIITDVGSLDVLIASLPLLATTAIVRLHPAALYAALVAGRAVDQGGMAQAANKTIAPQ